MQLQQYEVGRHGQSALYNIFIFEKIKNLNGGDGSVVFYCDGTDKLTNSSERL